MMIGTPKCQIRATFSDRTIRVYQAYNKEIASAALAHGTFATPSFRIDRMTWIKPSFLWMMYRSGWGGKEGQSRILGIDILRIGFEWAIEHSCLSRPEPSMKRESWNIRKQASAVMVQWDPERNIRLEALPFRTIQIGLRRNAVTLYANEWIQKIEDGTDLAHEVHRLVLSEELQAAQVLLPPERPYPH